MGLVLDFTNALDRYANPPVYILAILIISWTIPHTYLLLVIWI